MGSRGRMLWKLRSFPGASLHFRGKTDCCQAFWWMAGGYGKGCGCGNSDRQQARSLVNIYSNLSGSVWEFVNFSLKLLNFQMIRFPLCQDLPTTDWYESSKECSGTSAAKNQTFKLPSLLTVNDAKMRTLCWLFIATSSLVSFPVWQKFQSAQHSTAQDRDLWKLKWIYIIIFSNAAANTTAGGEGVVLWRMSRMLPPSPPTMMMMWMTILIAFK